MELRYEPQVFRAYPKMYKISSMTTKFMYNQLVKNRQYLKPFDISNTTQETNELGVCIVLGVFKGMVYGMDDVIK